RPVPALGEIPLLLGAPSVTTDTLPAPLIDSLPASSGAGSAQGAATSVAAPPAPTLTVHLLGPLRVTLADRPIESWPSGRGRAVFKYLLMHRDQPMQRDVLMDRFWPDATPEAARNNLNVALYGLRQALKMACDMPIVLFQEGAYRLNPQLNIWVD